MNADDTTLDDRIRALVAAAVAGAPEAPDVDVSSARDIALVGASAAPSSRRALVGVAVVVAVIAGLWAVVANGTAPVADGVTEGTEAIGDPSWVTAVEPTELSNGDTGKWPDDIAVVVASERGIERVAAPNWVPEVTRVYSAGPVTRAFELSDGSYVFHTPDGLVQRLAPYRPVSGSAGTSLAVTPDGDTEYVPDTVDIIAKGVAALDDAQLDGDGNLDLVYRSENADLADTAGTTQFLTLWLPPAEPVVMPLYGGWAVDYGRFDIVEGDTVASGWVDDTLQRGIAAFDASGAPVDRFDVFFGRGEGGPRDVVGDITGRTGVLSDSVFDVIGTVLESMELLEMSNRSGDLDLQGATVAIDRPDGPDTVVDLRYRSTFEIPIADGVTTVSQRTFAGNAPAVVDFGEAFVGNRLAGCMFIDPESLAPVESFRRSVRLGVPPTSYSDDVATVEARDVSGRPATLTTFLWGGVTVELAPPHWCGSVWLTVDAAHSAPLLEWLATVQIEEVIPSGMPTMVLAGRRGVSIITTAGTTAVTTTRAQRAVMLDNGDVAYQAAGVVYRWRHDTGEVDEMWGAVDFIAPPVLHDTYNGRVVYTVRDRLYVDGATAASGIPVELGGDGRLSVSADGLVLGGLRPTTLSAAIALPDWIAEAAMGMWAISGGADSSCCVAYYSLDDLVVTDRSGVPVWGPHGMVSMALPGLDVHDRWVAWSLFTPVSYESWDPSADDSIIVVDTVTGAKVSFSGMSWVSFADRG